MAARNEAKEEKKSFTVVGALAIVRGTDGRVKYLYRGATVPDGVSADELARLEELGLIESGADITAGIAAKPE
jgi:hypothetical protein